MDLPTGAGFLQGLEGARGWSLGTEEVVAVVVALAMTVAATVPPVIPAMPWFPAIQEWVVLTETSASWTGNHRLKTYTTKM